MTLDQESDKSAGQQRKSEHGQMGQLTGKKHWGKNDEAINIPKQLGITGIIRTRSSLATSSLEIQGN